MPGHFLGPWRGGTQLIRHAYYSPGARGLCSLGLRFLLDFFPPEWRPCEERALFQLRTAGVHRAAQRAWRAWLGAVLESLLIDQ
jgi:hypothetical protein